jgi:hypothetical protein
MKLGHHHRRPVSRWPGRILRGLRFDRNQLRRRSDRVETLLRGALIAVFAIGTPVAAHDGRDAPPRRPAPPRSPDNLLEDDDEGWLALTARLGGSV